MCIYMNFCMVLWARCDGIYCDILWIIISHIALRLIGLWIYYVWAVWILECWLDVVALKLTWEAILFLERWVVVWLNRLWRYYMHFLPCIRKPFNYFEYYFIFYGIWYVFMLLHFPWLLWQLMCYGFCGWLSIIPSES